MHLCATKFIPHLTTKILYMHDHVHICVGYNNTNLKITQRNTISLKDNEAANNLNMKTSKAVNYAFKNVSLPKCTHSSLQEHNADKNSNNKLVQQCFIFKYFSHFRRLLLLVVLLLLLLFLSFLLLLLSLLSFFVIIVVVALFPCSTWLSLWSCRSTQLRSGIP